MIQAQMLTSPGACLQTALELHKPKKAFVCLRAMLNLEKLNKREGQSWPKQINIQLDPAKPIDKKAESHWATPYGAEVVTGSVCLD